MKKMNLIFAALFFVETIAVGQVFENPSRNFFLKKTPVYFIAQYRRGTDGLYQYIDTFEGAIPSTDYYKYTEGMEHFFCYDKKNNIFYFFTDNTLGYYNPQSAEYIKLMRDVLKKNGVKAVKEEEVATLISRQLVFIKAECEHKNEKYIEQKRIARIQFIEDSIKTERFEDSIRNEYRKTHDWHKLRLAKSREITCLFCKEEFYKKTYNIVSINNDTIFYKLEKPEVTLLGESYFEIHYSIINEDFKNDTEFKDYLFVWADSIAQNQISTDSAYNEI